MLTFEVTEGKHRGKKGVVEMVYYDHKHTGRSADYVYGYIEVEGVYWHGTTDMCRVICTDASWQSGGE